MNRSKKLLSLLLAFVLIIGTVAVSSLSSQGAELITAFKFNENNWRSDMADNRPTMLESYNDGSLWMASNKLQQQYQMYFEVNSANSELLNNAINQACTYYDGTLVMSYTVNKAINVNGKACSPEVTVKLLKTATLSGDSLIAEAGANAISGSENVQLYFDVSKYEDEEYNYDIKFVYVQVQCYDWGCEGYNEEGVKVGGTIPDIKFSPIYVDNNEKIPDMQVVTTAPDPNRLTFNDFSPSGYFKYNNAPSEITYSADGVNFKRATTASSEGIQGFIKLRQINYVEQMQVKYTMTSDDDTTAAIVNANSTNGTGYVKTEVTLDSCKDPNGDDTIAEICLILRTKQGNQKEKPDDVYIRSWQYPGTTRKYYFDVSSIKNATQIDGIEILVQNYWYYDKEHKLFDFNEQSNYAGEETAIALGYQKCRIKPTVIVSPMTVEPYITSPVNTSYSFALNGYNKAGSVPADVTSGDPNVEGGDVVQTTTAGGSSSVSAPVISSSSLVAKNSIKVVWSAVSGATSYNVFRSTTANGTYSPIKSSVKTTSYTDTTVKAGTTYYYKVQAVKDANKSGLSAAGKAVKLINYAGKPTLTLVKDRKAITVKIKAKVKNATSYQVYYSTKKNFKGKKVITVATSKKISKLKSKTTYYVKARAVTTISGKKYYSKWSKIANTKTK